MGEILEAQCDHYSFLRNQALRRGEMTTKEQSENACGTASNEAFHREIGVWGQRVYRQTRALLQAKLNVLLFLKLSTFIYRKFHTAAQSQGYVAHIVAAQLRSRRDLTLLELDDVEHRRQQENERYATERERIIRSSE